MMNQAGIVISQIEPTQMGFSLINSLNTISRNYTDLDVIVYYTTIARMPAPPLFASLMEREIYGMQGVAIATDLTTAQRLIRVTGPKKKYFYIWNLEWVNMPNINYDIMSSIYNHKDIELIARSESHSKLIEKMWRKPKFIMDDFDVDTLRKILL